MTESLTEKLRDMRIKAGLSQYSLADRLGEKRQRLAAYEQGRFEPPLELLVRWAAACGMSVRLVIEPASAAPVEAETEDERTLLREWRRLGEPDRALVLSLARGLGARCPPSLRAAVAAVVQVLAAGGSGEDVSGP